MSTMVGMGPSPSDFREAEVEPVYLLTRRRSSMPPPPASSPVTTSVMPAAREPAVSMVRRSVAAGGDDTWDGESWSDDPAASDDMSDIRPVSRYARRRRGIRVLGALAIVGALAGGTFVLQKPKVRHEALSFVTMGHEDAAVRLGRRVASIAETLRHR